MRIGQLCHFTCMHHVEMYNAIRIYLALPYKFFACAHNRSIKKGDTMFVLCLTQCQLIQLAYLYSHINVHSLIQSIYLQNTYSSIQSQAASLDDTPRR